ncbi:MAG: protease modulator HflC [Chromatiales bacterium]|jgi:membrane protease subunit HflC|nr:protease modulator HflC [Chromatiales bacterium]
MNPRLIGIVAIAVALLAASSVFTVDEREIAVQFRFGEIQNTDFTPGIYLKAPFVDTVVKFPRRLLTIDNPQELFLTFEKKNLFVDFFIKWRITDVQAYYRASRGDESLAAQRLLEIVKDGIRGEFAKRTVPQVVSAERRELMDRMLADVRKSARELGIEVIDVRVKRTEFPEQVSDSVFERMRQERARVAAELRAQGAEAAEQIRAEADRQRVVTIAEAYRDAEKVRGQGDAEAARIYAEAYRRNPDFFTFYRSMQAYRSSLGKDSGLMVLDGGGEFFRYLREPGAGQ